MGRQDTGRTATPRNRRRSTRADAATHFRELAEHRVPGHAATGIERVLIDSDGAVVLGEFGQTVTTRRAGRAGFTLARGRVDAARPRVRPGPVAIAHVL
ncbi:hypothetical protein [Streptomyces brasiliensis]|uniref:Uncharacterized protein n=1 Tax=Streptomyces brasiliensis TaxID=1954 RepID=A0A917NTV1_9ACTN|nr:hypothetical protein GCM10010121_044140 [Streptomyces brasiliensis]